MRMSLSSLLDMCYLRNIDNNIININIISINNGKGKANYVYLHFTP